MNKRHLAARYVLFAFVATVVNVITQMAFFFFVKDFEYKIYLALLVGTLFGLVTKYVLDKKWIFSYETISHAQNIEKFLLYSLVSIFSTAIFWGFELGFYFYIDVQGGQYIGGTLGLAIGYACKYWLDKRFVFQERKLCED